LFGKAGEMGGQAFQTDLVSVTMSPQHFKAFIRSISETLKAYEAIYGELNIADADTAPLRDASQIEVMMREGREKSRSLRRAMISPSSTEKKPPAQRSRGARKAKEN
jgi:hypothetical protein